MSAAAAAPDPIFKLIEAHRAAYGEYQRLCRVYDVSPRPREADDVIGHAIDAEQTALEALHEATPVTLAGTIAFAQYGLAHHRELMGGEEFADDPSIRLLQAVERGLSGMAP